MFREYFDKSKNNSISASKDTVVHKPKKKIEISLLQLLDYAQDITQMQNSLFLIIK